MEKNKHNDFQSNVSSLYTFLVLAQSRAQPQRLQLWVAPHELQQNECCRAQKHPTWSFPWYYKLKGALHTATWGVLIYKNYPSDALKGEKFDFKELKKHRNRDA